MKKHIVREAFSLDGADYPRGAELTDPNIIAKAKEQAPGHIHATSEDIPEPPAPEGKDADA